MRIQNIMTTPVVTVEMDDMLYTVKDIFDHLHFHHLPVVENDCLQGMLSDRDLLKALSPSLGTLAETEKDLRTLKRRVHHIMTRDPVFLSPEDSVERAIKIFNAHTFSCIPVVDRDLHPVGMVSWRDIFKLLRRPAALDPEGVSIYGSN